MIHTNFKINMPNEVHFIIDKLTAAGFKAYIVGGCVRDSILGKEPNDWDLCTNAKPSDMLSILTKGNYPTQNGNMKVSQPILTGVEYGTITFSINNELYEVTTFRKETGYSDGRHPDKIEYAKTIEEDLARRDFTCNAMAYNDKEGLIDPYDAYFHTTGKMLFSVGMAYERFQEDALRIMRALRFASKYHWIIDSNTSISIHDNRDNLLHISKERIQEELCKILVEDCADILLEYPDVIKTIIPEMKDCIGFHQHNPYHDYDVYTHILETIRYCPSNDLITRLSLFFHDIGKPKCAVKDEKDPTRLHFYGHNHISAEMTDKILKDLHFDNETRKKVVELVEYHDTPFTVSEKFIRKWLHKIGPEQFERLINVRESDIKGQKKEFYEERMEKVNNLRSLYQEMMTKEQCFTLKDLKIKGKDLMTLGYKEGPVIGEILNHLLQKVINGVLENDIDILTNYIMNYNVEYEEEEQEL